MVYIHPFINSQNGYPMNQDRKTRRTASLKRLSRIEGQVRGLQKMIEDDRYCVDILVQVKAVTAALKKVEGELLKDHVDHCIASAMETGDLSDRQEKVAELVDLLSKR